MFITLKAEKVLLGLPTHKDRAKASKKAIIYGLASGTCTDSKSLAENIPGNITVQDLYAQQLIGLYDYATTHFHKDTKNSMLEDLKNGKKIYWGRYIWWDFPICF